MAFTLTFVFEKPDYRTLRFDIPFNLSLDKLDSALKCWASTTEPGSATNYDEIVLTEGVLWRDTLNHVMKIRNESGGWSWIHTNARINHQTNITAPITDVTDSFQQYANDIVAGNSAPHFRTENGKVIKLYQQTHIATVDSTVISTLTNAYGTADGTLEDIGATNSSDVSGSIENNFKECTTQITNLKLVVDDLRYRFNAILTYLENLGLMDTSGGMSASISPSVSASRSASVSASVSESKSASVSASVSASISASSSPSA